MKEIPLTQGKVALVDDEDYAELSKFSWYLHRDGNIQYAVRCSHRNPTTHKRNFIRMHAIILGTPKGMDTDHINGDGLDNRRENLRVVTKRQNQQNLHILKSSKFPGVDWNKSHKKWRTKIQINGKSHHLGYYNNEEMAARRYRIACDWQVIDL